MTDVIRTSGARRSAPAPRHEVLDIHDPATGEFVGWLPIAHAEEAADAVARARAAQRDWARTAPADRAGLLREAAAQVRAAADELAALNERETGRPRAEAVEGVLAGAATLEQYAELGPLHRGRSLQGQWAATDLMVPQPRGVVAVLTPWNDPVAVACGLLGAALVTGNTAVHKPSERAPHVGMLLDQTLRRCLPDGVLECLVGDGRTGAALVESGVDVVAHVGSTATGRAIARAVAGTNTKVLLENGGNDPLLVDTGVDPGWAAEQAAVGAFTNAGQLCTSVERVYVHRDLAEPFLAALTALAHRCTAHPDRDQRVLGPLVDRRQRDVVHAHVTDAVAAGAELLAGGEVPKGPGARYPATVLTGCHREMRIMREETFGPVAPVQVVDSFEAGLAEAVRGEHGLAATVLTPSMAHAQRAWRELPVGTVKINAVFGGAPGGAAQPRGASGTGFGYGPELLDELTTTKVVHLGLPPE